MPISYKNKIYTTLGTPTGLSGNVVSTTDSAGVPAKDYTVKGKTIVWNQLIQNGNFVDKSGWFVYNGTGSVSNNNYTFTVTGTQTYSFIAQYIDKSFFIANHKYYVTATIVPQYDTGKITVALHNGPSQMTLWTATASSRKTNFVSTTFTISSNFASNTTDKTRLILYCPHSESAQGNVTTISNVWMVDLTKMFGTGNEPATPAEFRAMFPDDYYPYSAGELKTIVPTSIEASGVERFQLLDKSKFTATKTISGVTFTNNGDGTITYNGTASTEANYTLQSGLNVIAGHKYFSYVGENTNGKISVLLYAHSDPYNTFDNRYPKAEGGISTALKNSDRLFYQPKTFPNISYSNFILKPQFFDLTEMFGAGNEPATPEEFWQRVPEKLYGYNPNDYKSANIPSSKYFPDGMKSAGSAYDEINFLSQKAIKRVGVRAYQTGDENDANVMTDKTNTVYELATPVETEITPPLQALPTYKGFTSFSAPNSLMQNGPLSVTYYAEGGANPESGWLTSYKRKLYMGRNIEWNQLFTNSRTSSNGVTISQDKDGTITLNGTSNKAYINFTNLSDAMNQLHKYLLCLKVLNNPSKISITYKWLNRYPMRTSTISSGESCSICNQTVDYIQLDRGNGIDGFAAGTVFNDVKIAVMAIDLTQMFSAGNEPATPAEFWTYFDHKLYPYNPGETQPLFKISRKSTVSQPLSQLSTPANISADGTTVSWDEVENATSYEILADGTSIGEVENVTEDALAGTWVFNETLELGNDAYYSLSFSSGDKEFYSIGITSGMGYLDFSTDSASYTVYNGEWQYDYKIITINSKLSEVENGDSLLTWLQANATKQ